MNALRIILTGVMLCMPIWASAGEWRPCDNAKYRRAHPYKCNTGRAIAIGAGGVAGALGIGAAIAATGASGGGGGGTSDAPIPTVTRHDMVGADVNAAHLAAVRSNAEYGKNNIQYDEIRAAYAMARGYTGKNSTIAVMDGAGWHGDMVREIAAGPIAPDARVEFRQIADKYSNFISYGDMGRIIATTRADIFNASWNVTMHANDIKTRAQLAQITDAGFIDEIVTAAKNDAIFVWAAGNNGATQSGALSAMPRVVPELNGHFINVVAYDTDNDEIASYSNACGTTMDYCITAPGTDIAAGNRVMSGTSFAAPIVSAAVAVLRDAFPYMSASEITGVLFRTARDIGAPGVDVIYGHGMLDLERATRPVGAQLVPIDGGNATPMHAARASGIIGKKIRDANLEFAFVDEYNRAFKTNMKHHIKVINHGRAFEHIRHNAKNSANFGDIEFGFRQSDLLAADGFLGINEKNTTAFIGLNHETDTDFATLFAHVEIGGTHPRGRADSMVTDFSGIYTTSVKIGARRGDWHAAITIPDAIISGNMKMRIPAGRANNGQLMFYDANIGLRGHNAVEYTAGYKFLTFGFVDNTYGTDEVFIIAKEKLVF